MTSQACPAHADGSTSSWDDLPALSIITKRVLP
jgi:hypothetical protein